MKPVFIQNKRLNRQLLSANPAAIPYLEQYPEQICWRSLSSNPEAIHLLAQYPQHICWYELTKNPNAIPLLEKNLDRVDWSILPCTFSKSAQNLRDVENKHA